jgi:hypothetical protein
MVDSRPDAEWSGFQMVFFRTLFESGFRMQNGGQSIQKQDKFVWFSAYTVLYRKKKNYTNDLG